MEQRKSSCHYTVWYAVSVQGTTGPNAFSATQKFKSQYEQYTKLLQNFSMLHILFTCCKVCLKAEGRGVNSKKHLVSLSHLFTAICTNVLFKQNQCHILGKPLYCYLYSHAVNYHHTVTISMFTSQLNTLYQLFDCWMKYDCA
jgi:hypothetical protein